jgi:hypothetical protein
MGLASRPDLLSASRGSSHALRLPGPGQPRLCLQKVNYVYLLEGVYAYQRVVWYRSAVSAAQVSLSVGAGPALGLTKPYYIEIAVPISATQAFIKVDTYDPQRYPYLDIVGEADFYLGFDKLRATPGMVG